MCHRWRRNVYRLQLQYRMAVQKGGLGVGSIAHCFPGFSPQACIYLSTWVKSEAVVWTTFNSINNTFMSLGTLQCMCPILLFRATLFIIFLSPDGYSLDLNPRFSSLPGPLALGHLFEVLPWFLLPPSPLYPFLCPLYSTFANLDSMLKSRDITLPTKVHLVKAMVFPVVTYGCESWTVKRA